MADEYIIRSLTQDNQGSIDNVDKVFKVFGRLVPVFDGKDWSFTEVLLERPYLYQFLSKMWTTMNTSETPAAPCCWLTRTDTAWATSGCVIIGMVFVSSKIFWWDPIAGAGVSVAGCWLQLRFGQ